MTKGDNFPPLSPLSAFDDFDSSGLLFPLWFSDDFRGTRSYYCAQIYLTLEANFGDDSFVAGSIQSVRCEILLQNKCYNKEINVLNLGSQTDNDK